MVPSSLAPTFLGNHVTKMVTFQSPQTNAKDQELAQKKTLIEG
jgi:hypothetical protein